jgi:hypothetical protein
MSARESRGIDARVMSADQEVAASAPLAACHYRQPLLTQITQELERRKLGAGQPGLRPGHCPKKSPAVFQVATTACPLI